MEHSAKVSLTFSRNPWDGKPPHRRLGLKPHGISCSFSVWNWDRHQDRAKWSTGWIRDAAVKFYRVRDPQEQWTKLMRICSDLTGHCAILAQWKGSIYLREENSVKVRRNWKLRSLTVTWTLVTGDSINVDFD
jgi:hypothetical protein